MTERHEPRTGPYLDETEMTLERAREAFGPLTEHSHGQTSWLTFQVLGARWVPSFTVDLECVGYEVRADWGDEP